MSNISFNPLAWAIKPLYLKAIAEDELFAKEVKEKESRTEKPKSLAECADYILGEAFEWAKEHMLTNNMSFSGLPDDETLNLIKHYYDEDDITIKKVTGAMASFGGSADDDGEGEETPITPQIGKTYPIPFPKCNNAPKAKETPKKKEEPASYDLFAGMWGDEKKEEAKPKPKAVAPKAVEDDDDLPL